MSEIKLEDKYKKTLDNFINILKNIYKDGLISVILYGSVSSGEFAQKHSDINLLVVLDDTNLENLSRVSKVINQHKFRLFKPLFFTEDYIKSSTDVFPIEFLDMRENYFVLYGKDCLAGIEISLKNLRFQCEQELKAKLLAIKNIYLRNRDKQTLKTLLLKSFTSVTHILRNLIRLKGKAPAYLKEDIFKQIAGEFQLDISNFRKILEIKQKNHRLNYKEITALLSVLVTDLEKIINIVDGF